jgi:DNA-binding GntR family transcriptional regulator
LARRTTSSATAGKARQRNASAATADAVKERREPLYVQVVAALKAEILRGVYPVGTSLPSEDTLGERFSVSRHTVREALRRLREDGLIASRQGVATTVVRPAAGKSYVHEVASINDLFSFVSALQFHIDTVGIVVTDAELAARLEVDAGQKWLKITGFRYPTDSSEPACWMEVYVHEHYAGIARLLDHNRGPIFELIETLYGERIVDVEQVLRTSPMPPHVAPALDAQPGETSVEVTRTFRISSGKIAQISVAHYPATNFQFSMKLRRTK